MTTEIPKGDGPHDPALLTTDAALLVQARWLRNMLIERAEATGDDTAGHMAACYKLHAAVFHEFHGLEQECEVHLARHVLLEETQQEVKRLRAELDEVQRPLDAQMARLNRRVIDLTAELDALRFKPLAKYDDVLAPFLSLMRRELHANAGKGDRPGWLAMSANEGLLEVYYHLAKLQKAVKHNDGPAIQEFSADVANMAMMVLDVCGGLAWVASDSLSGAQKQDKPAVPAAPQVIEQCAECAAYDPDATCPQCRFIKPASGVNESEGDGNAPQTT